MHRFYAPRIGSQADVELEGDEAHHLGHVLRIRPAEEVILFDGRGAAARAEVRSVSRRSVQLHLLEGLRTHDARSPRITLCTAIPKSDRLRWLVEKATELEVDRLVPIRTARSVVHPGNGKLERLESTVIAACKQCGRNDLMDIESTTDFSSALDLCTGRGALLADPDGSPLSTVVRGTASHSDLVVFIGPEGGFSPEEIAQAEARGVIRLSLGRTVLRTETAAIALAACLRMMPVFPPL